MNAAYEHKRPYCCLLPTHLRSSVHRLPELPAWRSPLRRPVWTRKQSEESVRNRQTARRDETIVWLPFDPSCSAHSSAPLIRTTTIALTRPAKMAQGQAAPSTLSGSTPPHAIPNRYKNVRYKSDLYIDEVPTESYARDIKKFHAVGDEHEPIVIDNGQSGCSANLYKTRFTETVHPRNIASPSGIRIP